MNNIIAKLSKTFDSQGSLRCRLDINESAMLRVNATFKTKAAAKGHATKIGKQLGRNVTFIESK